jgi:AAA domain
MLIYVTGVAGSGKTTLRAELQERGHRARDADEGFCAWFDADGNQVPTLALHLRTPRWYMNHRWRLLPERVAEFAHDCETGLGFLLGVATNADEMAPYFGALVYLTADAELIRDRLRDRDGTAHATRFAAFASVRDWQHAQEQHWVKQGYTPLDSAADPSAVAEKLLCILASN